MRLGPTDELDWMKRQQRLTFARIGVIDPLSLSEYSARDGLKGLKKALALSPAEVVDQVRAIRPARARRRRLPRRRQVEDRDGRASRPQICGVQRR